MKKLVGYVTDIEGNWDYWTRYLKLSKVLLKDNSSFQLFLRDNCEFVYGGDVCDRGPGDIRVMQDLVQLKDRYPNRVHIILGNRDINKLRMLSEMNHVGDIPVYWNTHSHHFDDTIEGKVSKLKWMLKDTMGSPDAFEYRRQELNTIKTTNYYNQTQTQTPHQTHISCTDQDVLESYINSLKPDGILTQYLERGKIAHIIQDTLFVHGAIRKYNLGWIPPSLHHIESRKVTNIHEWCDEMNTFCHHEVIDYKNRIIDYIATHNSSSNIDTHTRNNSNYSYWAYDGGYHHPQPGSRLLQYGMGWLKDKSVNPSAIYSSYFENNRLHTLKMRNKSDKQVKTEAFSNNVTSSTTTILNSPSNVQNAPSNSLTTLYPFTLFTYPISSLYKLVLHLWSLLSQSSYRKNDHQLAHVPPSSSMSVSVSASSSSLSVPLTTSNFTPFNSSIPIDTSDHNSNRSTNNHSSKHDTSTHIDRSSHITTDIHKNKTTVSKIESGTTSNISNPPAVGHSSSVYETKMEDVKDVWISTMEYDEDIHTFLQYHKPINVSSDVNTSVKYPRISEEGKDREDSNKSNNSNVTIQRIIVGHQPKGDCPTILTDTNNLMVILGDTSYAVDAKWEYPSEEVKNRIQELHYTSTSVVPTNTTTTTTPTTDASRSSSSSSSNIEVNNNSTASVSHIRDTRGIAVSEILLEYEVEENDILYSDGDNCTTNTDYNSMDMLNQSLLSSSSSSSFKNSMSSICYNTDVRIHGVLSNGMTYDYKLSQSNTTHLGKKNQEGWFVKAIQVQIPSISEDEDNSTIISMNNESEDGLGLCYDKKNEGVHESTYEIWSKFQGFGVINRLVPLNTVV